tara:strand:- start:319 stop:666 length:348 start_codon:yes stop_codon:yes gene_type:complete
MTDPRKPVHTPETEQANAAARKVALDILADATLTGARALGCTGASFVLMGIGIWGRELCELDAKATAQMFRAIGDIYDQASNHTKLLNAEKRRKTAVRKLFAALDLEMANTEGSA